MKCLVTFLVVILNATCLPLLAAEQSTQPTSPKFRIALAGDSTVTDNAGWGKGFEECFTSDVEVINFSKGGRASGSFVKEGLWQKVLDLKPDYVLVQFGHNDQPGHGDRETDPQTTYKANMTRYVDEGRAAGIKVILVTSLSRRQWGDDGRIHSTLQPYVDAVKQIAAEKNVPLIDLHTRSIAIYEKLGRDGVIAISPEKAPTTTQSVFGDDAPTKTKLYDGTHLNAKGSAMIGPIVAEELGRVAPELATFIQLNAKPPTDQANANTIVVAGDGSGAFKTIQEAIAAVPDNSTQRTIITIKPGVYEGYFSVSKNKAPITLHGEDATTTILTWSRNVYDPIPAGHDKFNPSLFVAGDDFRAENVTIRNTSGDHGQALAVRVDGDRAAFKNCRLLGWQDTLMVNNGRQYFKNCYIEGRVDFIYGSGTAVFDACTIHSKNGGYVTAASTPQDQPFGFVFMNCKLTGDDVPFDYATTNPATTQQSIKPNKLTYLGRPWRDYAAVAFIHCNLGDHVRAEGWHNWNKPEKEKTARYSEFENTGAGSDRSKRVGWAKELTKDEAATYTLKNILGGKDDWNPAGD